MTRINRTVYAVLGMLAQKPSSGYDLKKDFERRMRSFWAESIGQIYPTLRRLREEGLVSAEEQRRSGRSRTVYSITPDGRRKLRDWLEKPAAPVRMRNELTLKLYFGSEMSIETALGHIARYEAAQMGIRALYRDFEAEIEAEARSEKQEALWKIALLSGQTINEARLRWCREARRRLEQLHQDHPPPSEGHDQESDDES